MIDIRRWVLVAAGIALAAGCAQKQGAASGSEAAHAEAPGGEVRVVNTICPVAEDDFVEPYRPANLVRTRQGTAIGFCCKGCVVKYDAMTAAQQDEILRLARANKGGEEE